MNAALLLSLIEIAEKAYRTIEQIRRDDPAAFDAVSAHVKGSPEAARAEALKPSQG